MAALSAISALPMLGNIASGALTMFKCAKAAKYVKTASKVISNAATFGVAAAGGTKSIKNIYKNVKQGNVFTKENFAELANIGLSAFTMICSGKNTIASGKELGGMLKEDVPKAWSSVKKSFKTFAADNRGVVDFNAPIGNGNLSTQTITNKFPNDNQSGKVFKYEINEGRLVMEQNSIHNMDFVIDSKGNLILGSGHSFLADGQSVQAAGSLKIDAKGYVKGITNWSGHYQPTVSETLNYPSMLQNVGLNMNKAWIHIDEFNIDPVTNYVIYPIHCYYNGPVVNILQ